MDQNAQGANDATTEIQEITLENWHYALAPISQEEQERITIAIAGITKLADHIQVDARVGEMDEVAGSFAALVSSDAGKQEAIGRLLNHTLSRALKNRE